MRYSRLPGLFLLAASLHAESPADALEIVRRLEKERVALAGRLADSVCAVFRGGGGGSGVIISPDGLVISNFHVTELSSEMRIGLNDHLIHPAIVLGVDPSGDLALLRLKEKRRWSYAELGDSDALRQGDWVYAMGNPFLLATDFSPTITLGVVSGIHRYQPGSMRGTLLYPDCVQTDASINPGNSGGPLFNFLGRVVGINGRVSLRDRGRVNIGVGYAISSNQIKLCLPELRAGKIVQHGTLNATVRGIDDPQWPGGLRITFDQMLAPGAAHSAGIQVGDALLSFMGREVTGTNDFLRRISVMPKGRRVSVKVARYEKGKWLPHEFRIDLDGIPLIRKADAVKKETPRTYIEKEVERTFAAARATIPPIVGEVRTGRRTVRGREPKAIEETLTPDGATVKLDGVTRRTDTEEIKRKDWALDMLERIAALNDLVDPAGAGAFKSVDFTGGAMVGGVTVDRFEVEARNGNKRVYFIQLDTGRLLRMDLYSQSWVRWVSFYFDDWRTAGGLTRPYRTTLWDREKETLIQTYAYTSIRKS